MQASRLSTSASASLPVGSAGCATCAPNVAPFAWLAFSKACAISPSHISTLPLPSTKVLAVFVATVESAVPEVAGGALSQRHRHDGGIDLAGGNHPPPVGHPDRRAHRRRRRVGPPDA